MIPRAAQMRQQQANERRAKLEESAARAAREDMFAGKNVMRRIQRPVSRFSNTNRYTIRDPNRGVITQAEWNTLVEQHEDSGSKFRYIFFAFVLLSVAILGMAKYDVEFNLEPPQIENGEGLDKVVTGASSGTTTEELEKYYETLGVQMPRTTKMRHPDGNEVDNTIDPVNERKLENYRTRKAIEQAYMKHQEQRGQLVHCGRSCEAKNQQMEKAYMRLTSHVESELFSVLLDETDKKSKRRLDATGLKRAYEAKKEKIEANEKNEEVREMALEELKDAYDILVNPEARNYYLLYGMKPPEYMRHTSTRSGGWGQEVMLGTYKHRVILAWLDLLHEYIGLWGETFVLLCALMFVLSRIPTALQQSQRLLDDLDWENSLEQENKDRSTATATE